MDPRHTTVSVSEQLIEQMGEDVWSEPVQFKFVRLPDGTVDLCFRNVPWPSLRVPSGPVAATRETR